MVALSPDVASVFRSDSNGLLASETPYLTLYESDPCKCVRCQNPLSARFASYDTFWSRQKQGWATSGDNESMRVEAALVDRAMGYCFVGACPFKHTIFPAYDIISTLGSPLRRKTFEKTDRVHVCKDRYLI